MLFLDAMNNSNPSPCKYALDFQRVTDQTIFAFVTPSTSLEQIEHALLHLQSLYLELAERLETLDTLHFPSSISGRHRCLKGVYREAVIRLENFVLMRAEQEPIPAPLESTRTPDSLEEVLSDLDEPVQVNPDEFYIGEAEETPKTGATDDGSL
jgi:hypothetical protein